MRTVRLIICLLSLSFMAACDNNRDIKNNDKLGIITTLFPQYDFVKQIGGDKVSVKLLLPAGVEPHSYEPTPKDILDINNADLFIYTSEAMEPWVYKIMNVVKSEAVDCSKGISLLIDDHCHGVDPHIWLDPVYAKTMVDNIVDGLVLVDPENESFYRERGADYKKELYRLDNDFKDMISKTKYNKIVYAGHFAFGYFILRYGLEVVSPYNGFSPNAEPTSQSIIKMVKVIRDMGIPCIYYEELIDPKVARIISEESSTEMLMLHGAHNLSKQELQDGLSYLQIMRNNLEQLKVGLGYNE